MPGGRAARAPYAPVSPGSLGLRIALAAAAIALLWALPRWPGETPTSAPAPPPAAETFWVEEIIDPRDTRRLLCDFARLAEPLRRPQPSRLQMRP